MQINLPDPPLADGFPVFGSSVDDHEFQGVLNHGLFKAMVPDPRRLEGTLAKYNTDLAPVADLRARVQRLITGAKRRNVEPYAKYIIRKTRTGEGFTPQIVLWSPRKLRVEVDSQTGLAWAIVPHDLKLVALDGDTQTTARNLAEGLAPGLLDKTKVKVAIIHGIPEDDAAQVFSDCNSEGVKVTTSMAIGLDNRDDATRLAKSIEKSVPALTGLVNRQKRQLSKSDKEVVTISALRTSVVCFDQGIGGVQNQTKSVEIDEADFAEQEFAAKLWYTAATDALNGALAAHEREYTFASAPAVWAAIGAIGRDVWQEAAGQGFHNQLAPAALEHAFHAAAEKHLGLVDWRRGDHWAAVGAKKSLTGVVTLGGPKESGSLVYKALKDGVLHKPTAEQVPA